MTKMDNRRPSRGPPFSTEDKSAQLEVRGLYVIRSKHTDEWRGSSGFFYRGTATGFQSFNQAGHTRDVEAEFTSGFYGLDGGTAGSADIIDNHHASAFFLKAFHAPTHAVRFFRFTHQEAMDQSARLRADHGSSDHDGISAHGKSSNSLRMPALFFKELKKNASGEFRAAGVERGGAAINVVVALSAGREGEFAEAERVGSQQLKKLFARRRHRISRLTDFPAQVPCICRNPCVTI